MSASEHKMGIVPYQQEKTIIPVDRQQVIVGLVQSLPEDRANFRLLVQETTNETELFELFTDSLKTVFDAYRQGKITQVALANRVRDLMLLDTPLIEPSNMTEQIRKLLREPTQKITSLERFILSQQQTTEDEVRHERIKTAIRNGINSENPKVLRYWKRFCGSLPTTIMLELDRLDMSFCSAERIAQYISNSYSANVYSENGSDPDFYALLDLVCTRDNDDKDFILEVYENLPDYIQDYIVSSAQELSQTDAVHFLESLGLDWEQDYDE